MTRYQASVPITGTCERCGEEGTATATIDTAANVAAWQCPHCGRTQEPPADAARADR